MKTLVPFGDLKRQYEAIRSEIDKAVAGVLERGWYILGSEVQSFEEEFATYCGVNHCIGVANGTDALYLALAAHDIGPGDEVITVANACIYQTAAILQTGAKPVFVDIDPITHTMDVSACEAAITPATRALLPVHLYGRLADMHAINRLATRHNLAVIEDAAQAHGAWREDAGHMRRAGSWGSCGCFSFYPSKNLGALGDGGAVVTNDERLAQRLRQLRQYGWSSKYVTTEGGGRNSRLDELQAAILRVKLRHLNAWNDARREHALRYSAMLADTPLELPPDEHGHVYHLYVVAHDDRDLLRNFLQERGIGTDIHYPLPAHLQPAYRDVAQSAIGTLPQTERQAKRVLSLPIFPELTLEERTTISDAVYSFFQSQRSKEI